MRDPVKLHGCLGVCPWCLNYGKRTTARAAIKGIEQLVDYTEVGPPYDGRTIHLGHVGGVFLDGKAYRPYQLIGDSSYLRAEIVRLYEHKQPTDPGTQSE